MRSPWKIINPYGWLRERFCGRLPRMAGVALALTNLFVPVQSARAQTGTETARTGYPVSRMLLDAALPGYGAFSHGKYWQGGLIMTGRLASLYVADGYYVRGIEYDSAWRAARLADLYYGPGYRYMDPYGRVTRTTDDFRHIADRNKYYFSLSMVVHAAITVASLLYTDGLLRQELDNRTPQFYMDNGSKESTDETTQITGWERSIAMDPFLSPAGFAPSGPPPGFECSASLFRVSVTLLDF